MTRESDVERITAFDHRFAKAQASDVIDLAFGFALLQRDFPLSEYNNRLVVTSPAPVADVLAAAERILGGAGLRHRYISADLFLGEGLRDELMAAGYEGNIVLTMQHAGHDLPYATHRVDAVTLDELRATLAAEWRATIPAATDEHVRQLIDRTDGYARGADFTRLAVRDGDEIAAHADLYVDRVDRIAQFENLATNERFRGRGYATSLVRDAIRRSHEAGAEITFLTADLDDWPRQWYQRMGYREVARTLHFSRR